jgi:hypothetical protein
MGTTANSTRLSVCTSCAPGRYGDKTGVSLLDCSGPCLRGVCMQLLSIVGHVCTMHLLAGVSPNSSVHPHLSHGSSSSSGFLPSSPPPLHSRAPGRYGNISGLTSEFCTDMCQPGYGCEAGSTDPRAQQCPAGKYSDVGICEECPPGTYGQGEGMNTSACTGPCPAGRWGSGGSFSAECDGPCAGGYACPPGVTNSTPGNAYKCTPGKYNAEGSSSNCTNCSSGLYGSTHGLVDMTCTAECRAGHFCPSGATNEAECVWAPEAGDSALNGFSSPPT